jgi:RNA polymerase sigma-70 factor (ECF subfamily)
VQLYAPLVYHWCRRWRLSEADLADVFQEVFQTAAANLHRFEKTAPGHTFRGWLRRITHNKVHDHYRRMRREPPGLGGSDIQRRLADLGLPADRHEEDDAVETAAQIRLVRQALEQLRGHFKERTWEAFWRTAVEGRPTIEVAGELLMSPVGVRVARSRVLQRLREELGDMID